MISYGNFILLENKLWKGTKEISLEEAVKIIKEKCTEFSPDDNSIHRYVPSFDKLYYQVDPKQHKRKSTSGIPNVYTLIMDETWIKEDNYPQRSNSLICRLNYKPYEVSYRVIPFDGAKFGVCSTDDIWDDWNDKLRKMEIRIGNTSLLSVLDKLFFEWFGYSFRDDNYEDLMDDLDNLNSYIVDNNYDITSVAYQMNNFFSYLKKNNLSLQDFFLELYSNNDNNFSLKSYKELLTINTEGLEVWTDSECILIRENEENKLLSLL